MEHTQIRPERRRAAKADAPPEVDASRLALVADSLSVLSCLMLEVAATPRASNLSLVDPDQFASLLDLLSQEIRYAGQGSI